MPANPGPAGGSALSRGCLLVSPAPAGAAESARLTAVSGGPQASPASAVASGPHMHPVGEAGRGEGRGGERGEGRLVQCLGVGGVGDTHM